MAAVWMALAVMLVAAAAQVAVAAPGDGAGLHSGRPRTTGNHIRDTQNHVCCKSGIESMKKHLNMDSIQDLLKSRMGKQASGPTELSSLLHRWFQG
ncbi:hypothetical protein ZWY2020_011188 [Hordeum vulgare]|nr:hypothetical protein ZWY2020_011188 [Hordeum vulgare]